MKKFYSLLLAVILVIANLVPVSAETKFTTKEIAGGAYFVDFDVKRQYIKLNSDYGQIFNFTLVEDTGVKQIVLEYKKPNGSIIKVPLNVYTSYKEDGVVVGHVYRGAIAPKSLTNLGLYEFIRLHVVYQDGISLTYEKSEFSQVFRNYFNFSTVKVPKALTSLALNVPSKIVLGKGSSKLLVGTVNPYDAFYFSSTWTSSNLKAVEGYYIHNNIEIEAVGIGKSTVTYYVNTKDKTNSVYDKKVSTVVIVPGAALNKRYATLYVKGTTKLYANVMNLDGTTYKIWKTSNSNILKVDQYGNVTAVAKGVADIIVTTKDGKYSARCTVTVK